MPGGLSKRTQEKIKKFLAYDYLEEKGRRKLRKQKKTQRLKGERHKSKRQEIEELLEQELADAPEDDR